LLYEIDNSIIIANETIVKRSCNFFLLILDISNHGENMQIDSNKES